MPKFDVFLSHNSVDKPWVSALKDDLQRYGVSVWLDKDEIRPGNLFAQVLEEALAASRAVALIVSPEALASGWVKEEYYRALSLAKAETPLQLIPVILRGAELPGFLESRSWIDFRDEAAYAEKVRELVWGITGVKPLRALDLTAPTPPYSPSDQLAGRVETANNAPTQAGLAFRTGGVKARGKIQAENIVTGIQVQDIEAEMAHALLDLAKSLQSGEVEAGQDLLAKNIVTGFQYLGQSRGEPDRSQFQQELNALREELRKAIAAGEFADTYEAEDAQKAVERAAEQSAAASPLADKITTHLDRAVTILTKASEAAIAARKFGATVIKLAPLAAGLKQLVDVVF